MNKSRYVPFERNRYFYGKLLTVRDFESEQKYINDKRRFANRLLYGSGVISGLQVVAVDDKSVSVEMGAALDALGREIVLPAPVTLKLSMIEGFTNNEYAKNVYLCIAYAEKGKEPVHSVANASVRTEEINEYNRVLESYRLFIKEEAPDPNSFEHLRLTENTWTIYQDAQIRVMQKSPRYVHPDELFEVTFIVEKTLQSSKISFEYAVETENCELADETLHGIMRFDEPVDTQQTRYETVAIFRAGKTVGDKARISYRDDSVKLRAGDRQITVDSPGQNEFEIIEGSIRERIAADYFDRSLDEAMESGADPCVHLAKISLVQMGPTYMIEKVDLVPFGEYVYNTALTHQLDHLGGAGGGAEDTVFLTRTETSRLAADQNPEFAVRYNPDQNEFLFKLGLPEVKALSDDVTTGVVDIPIRTSGKGGLAIFLKSEKKVFSDEINHGLGKGSVLIVTALEEQGASDAVSDLSKYSEKMYFGAVDIFKGSEYESDIPTAEIGTLLYPKKGNFRIGVKMQAIEDADHVRVRWWAIKKQHTGLEEAVGRGENAIDPSEKEAAATRASKSKTAKPPKTTK